MGEAERRAARKYRKTEKGKATIRAAALRYYEKRKAMMRDLKAAPCSDCGGSFNPVCMDFDHVRGVKEGNIANIFRTAPWDRVLAEVAKCDLVCANCHRVRTEKRRQEA